MDWRKSSYSGSNGSCVETASGNGAVLVRDTKDRDGWTLSVPAAAWTAFLATLRLGSGLLRRFRCTASGGFPG
jgi:hypothetical protein